MNHTRDGLLNQPIAIAAIPPGPPPAQYLHPGTANTNLATTPPGTQIPTLLLAAPLIPPAILTAVILAVLIAAPLATLIATPAAPPGTPTPPSPPPAQYLYPSTARDRPNHTLNGLAIGLESVQPIATAIAIIPPGT